LIKRPGFPAAILPAVTVCANLIHFLLAFLILLIFLLVAKSPLTSALWLLPIVVFLQFGVTLGLSYFLATFHVIFRDTQHLLNVFLLLLFYLTPIFYDIGSVPSTIQTLLRLNPMLHLLDAYRSILLQGEPPSFLPLAIIAIVSILLLFVGYRVFVRASYQFAEKL
jgi:lipopolysaccharide transport system permease protein